jgi:hypothetical protein
VPPLLTLIAPLQPRFGVRFMDMGTVYASKLRQALASA